MPITQGDSANPPGLAKSRAITLLAAGALLALESLDSILAHEGHARAYLAFQYSNTIYEALEGDDVLSRWPQITFDVALAYADGVTIEQLRAWIPECEAEGLPCHHSKAALAHLETVAEGGKDSEEPRRA